jgi:hypothetical protein
MSLCTTKCFIIIYKQHVFPNFILFIFQLIIWGNVGAVHEPPFRNPFCVCHKLFWVILQFYITDFKVHFIPGVNNTNSCVIFRVSSFTFYKYLDYTGIFEFIWNIYFYLYIIKNCSNLSFNSSSMFLNNSELTLSSHGLVLYFVNL